MRFPFGIGGGGKSGDGRNSMASDRFKKNNVSANAPQESLNKRLEKMLSSSIAEYTKVKQRNAQARGGEAKELSPNAKKMLELLARQKLQKEIKKEKQQADALKRAEKQKKEDAARAKKLAQYQNDLKAKQLAEQQAAASQPSSAGYWFGYNNET